MTVLGHIYYTVFHPLFHCIISFVFHTVGLWLLLPQHQESLPLTTRNDAKQLEVRKGIFMSLFPSIRILYHLLVLSQKKSNFNFKYLFTTWTSGNYKIILRNAFILMSIRNFLNARKAVNLAERMPFLNISVSTHTCFWFNFVILWLLSVVVNEFLYIKKASRELTRNSFVTLMLFFCR